MKLRCSILFAMTLGCVNLLAQGTVDFANNAYSAVANSLTGSWVDAGGDFNVALYYLPDRASPPATSDFDREGFPCAPWAGFHAPGLFSGGLRTTPPTTAPGGWGWFQVRAWETEYGASYEEALTAPPKYPGAASARTTTAAATLFRRALIGTSNIIRVSTGSILASPAGGQEQSYPKPPGALTDYGLQSFSVVEVPAQGLVDFANDSSSAVINSLTGYPATSGTTFKAGLYYLPDSTRPPTHEGQFTTQLGASAAFASPGVYAGGTRATPSSPPGSFGYFIVKVWETAFGTSYESALANPNTVAGRRALVGTSNIIRTQTGATAPAALLGLQSFSLVPVPADLLISGFSVDSVITFNTETGHTYNVEKTISLNPVDWQPLPGATAIPGTGSPVSVSDKGAGCLDQRYYRVRLVE